MKVSIIGGTGYVGLVTGVGLAVRGCDVICADIDTVKIEGLKKGVPPIFEEGLPELLTKAMRQGRIMFTDCIKTAVANSDILMVAVGTPEGKSGDTDMSQIVKALKSIAANMEGYKAIVIKSTVPVGTCEMARIFVRDNLKNPKAEFDVVSNPEFLREGSAVADFLNPERIVIGVDSERAGTLMRQLYKGFDAPLIMTDTKSSEMVKYACNTYLATRISFVNEMAEICEKVGADISSVIEGMKHDKRIGKHYLNPGPGFGGPCLSKDLKALIHFAGRSNANVGLLKAVLNRNELQIKNIIGYIGGELNGRAQKRVAVLGLSFKAGTADTRNSPSIKLVEKLAETGNTVVVYDPVVKEIEKTPAAAVIFAGSLAGALAGSDCAVIMTEWNEFRNMDLEMVSRVMSNPYIIDTRNIISPEAAKSAGIKYKGIGIRDTERKADVESLKEIAL